MPINLVLMQAWYHLNIAHVMSQDEVLGGYIYIYIYIYELDKGKYNTSKHISAMSRHLGLEKSSKPGKRKGIKTLQNYQ